MVRTLREIALAHGTDKEQPHGHSYTEAYDFHFAPRRSERLRLLEIGVGGYDAPQTGGESLRMWREYFPNAEILGLDLFDKTALTEDRIRVFQGNQGDAAFMQQFAAEHGPFDIVIDDGSHCGDDVIASFRVLFPHLTTAGIYVVEDLQTSYWDRYNRSSQRATRFLKSLVDGLNYAEFDVVGYQPTYLDQWIKSLTFYHNLAFVYKGENIERSVYIPPHPNNKHLFRLSRLDRIKRRLHRWTRR